MFENYSLADLLANTYKNFKKNIIVALAAFLVVLAPFVLKAVQHKDADTSHGTNYSTYIVYNVESDRVSVGENGEKLEPFSEFFANLIYANMNGAYIFEDVDEKVLDKISDDLSIDKVQLRNTDSNYWSGKIEVKSTAENGSVTVRLLTASEEFNELVEEKVDALVKEAETHLENVTINKVNSFTTSSPTDTENEDEIAVKGVAINKGTIIKGAVIAFIFAVFFVLFMNFVLYVFNPSMNGVSAFEKYGLKFIYEYRGTADLAEVLKYVEENEGKVTLMTTSDKVKTSFDKKLAKDESSVKYDIVNAKDTHAVLAADRIMFIEECGITRYRDFEKALRQAENFGKEVAGVINIPL